MAAKQLNKLLNDLINESESHKSIHDLTRINALDIPVNKISPSHYSINLNNITIFEGIENIVSSLLEEIRESCFFGQSDVSVTITIDRETCPQFYDFGIHKIFFYSLIENLERLPFLYKDMVNHLRYIFNALQSPGINKGLFTSDTDSVETKALLFPFNRVVEADQTRLHYLVERVAGSHFLRITAEELDHSRLNLRRINHLIISNIELINNFFDVRQNAFVIHSSLVNRCYDNKLNYNDSGHQLVELIHFLKSTGYTFLRDLTLNWPRNIINDVISGNDQPFYRLIIRILLILSDSVTLELLSGGATIETFFENKKAFLSLTQRGRNLQIDLQEKMVVTPLDEYLIKMDRLNIAVKKMDHLPDNLHLIFIHHFTAETLAVLGAFDKLNINTVDTLWVKYSGGVPSKYIETIMALPSSVYRFYGLQPVDGKHSKAKFCLSDRYSSIDDFTGLQWWLEVGEFEFFPAMQRVAMHLFLNAMLKNQDTRIVIAEDGGYIAPLINRLALEKKSVADVFELFGYENGLPSLSLKDLDFGHWIKPRFSGSVEHTRNGYDALMSVENEFGKLAFPACSLAISDFKVNTEAIEVAYSCLNAIENILASQGFVLSNRTCLVLGSLGAIGIQTMHILSHRLGNDKLAGVDLRTVIPNKIPWNQVTHPNQLHNDFKYSVDLFFGVIGRSVLDVPFFEDLILNTTRKELFLASGSTKRFEFIDFLSWTEILLDTQNPKIQGIPLTLTSRLIEDPQSAALQGTIYTFSFEKEKQLKHVDIYVLSNGMPVNFQYYGVARETMDAVMTEFVSLVNVVSNRELKHLDEKTLALDHNIDINGNKLKN